MKTRLSLALLAVVSIITCFILIPNTQETSNYSPRLTEGIEAGWHGALEHYAMMRKNVETGKVEEGDYARMLSKVREYKKNRTNKDLGFDFTWEVMGPTNFGGRTRDMCATEAGVLFAGGVSGGLFRSWDSGNTWHRVTGFKDNMNVTSVEEIGNGTLFVGTGSLFDFASGAGGSGFHGSGVYKSTDGGDTWSPVPGLSTDLLITSGDFRSVDVLYADPQNPTKVWVGCNGGLKSYDDSSSEIIDSFDGISFAGPCQDMEISEDGNTMIVVLGTAVYRSTDAGSSWQQISGASGLPTTGANRVGLAMSKTNPNYMYALLSNGGRMGGVYASTDGGNTWLNIWPANNNNSNPDIDPFGDNGQGFYDLVITIDPTDDERVFVGGVTLWEAGLNIQPQQIAFNFGFGPNYVHSDIHHFEWIDNTLYVATDGGFHISSDITFTSSPVFLESNFGYNTTQFYGIGVSTTGRVNGGTQDQSTFLLYPNTTLGLNQFGGDGFDTDISAVSDAAQFATSQFGRLGRSFDGGNSFNEFYDPELANLQNQNQFPFHSLVRLYENTDDPFSQDKLTFVATEDTMAAGETVILRSNNLNIPFEYTLEDSLFIRDEVTFFQEIISEVDDSLITLTYQFPESEYNDPEFEFEDEVLIGITEVDVELPDEDIVESEVVENGIVTVTVSFTEDVEVSSFGDVTYFNLPDTLEIIDRYTSLLAVYSFGGIYVTRDALDANVEPDWTQVVSGNLQANCIEFSADGNHMFVGSENGDVYRISNLRNFWGDDDADNVTLTRIFRRSGQPVMGVSPDPDNINRLAVAMGGYGQDEKVWITEQATTATETNGTEFFEDIWFSSGQDFAGMPCYDVCIVKNFANDEDVIMVATEFGVWATNDLNDNNSWEQCDVNLGNIPVFAIRQQYRGPERFIPEPTNTGMVYIGSHGSGIWKTSGVVSVEEQDFTDNVATVNTSLSLFPNPTTDLVNIELDLDQGQEINLEIYDLNGRLVFNQNMGYVSNGLQILTTYVGDLGAGTYILNAHGDNFARTGKLVVR